MIATYVSSQNDCYFCQHAHGAVAAYRLGGNEKLVNDVTLNFESAAISEKLKTLLAIAGRVQMGGKQVTHEDVLCARQQGATDKEIHDTVLIAAAFCMYNRYVDGLATWAPIDADLYRENGRRLAEEGYVQSTAVDRTLTCRAERVCLVFAERRHVVRRVGQTCTEPEFSEGS